MNEKSFHLITAFIAVIGFLQYWLILGYQKIIKRPKLHVRKNRDLSLGFGTYCPSATLDLSLMAENSDIFIDEISLKIVSVNHYCPVKKETVVVKVAG